MFRPARHVQALRVLPLLALLPAACGGGTGDGGGGETTRAPERAGEVWELDGVADRAQAAASVVAFVEGMHVMVLDGKDAFTGMRKLRAESGPDGAKHFTLPSGVEADILPTGDVLQLRFSSGETIALRKRDVPTGGRK